MAYYCSQVLKNNSQYNDKQIDDTDQNDAQHNDTEHNVTLSIVYTRIRYLLPMYTKNDVIYGVTSPGVKQTALACHQTKNKKES